MASLIQGYEYDIFISYRQKDNKYDGWVTDFVDNLKRELEATFKEEVSVYFDINPHDGLLETHDVDASLKEKLKCLIFIPIISRTYCDPKSFAWEHEFKAFIEEASTDRFGLKVKLPNGNVATRVLPVRIHDLDSNDIQLCESVLGGVLRGVEFIYKEPGVNRSLTPKDKEKKNLNDTIYRNQINKVALAIKEIILGLQAGRGISTKESGKRIELFGEADIEKKPYLKQKLAKSNKYRLPILISIIALLITAGVFILPKILRHNTLANLQSSGNKLAIAVMPFQNMTNDTKWNTYQEGIQTNLISSLTNTGELFVRKKENINNLLNPRGIIQSGSISPSVADKISSKLEADFFINGTIQHAGSTLLLNAELIDTKTMEILKSFEVMGPYDEDKIFEIADSLRKKVTDFLLISNLIKENPVFQHFKPTTTSAEAFRNFIKGGNALNKGDLNGGITWFLKALAVDSNFADAAFALEHSYAEDGNPEQSRKWLIRDYKRRDHFTYDCNLYASWAYAYSFESPDEQIKYLKLLQELDDKEPSYYWLLGLTLNMIKQYEKAIPELEKCWEIHLKWGDEYLEDTSPLVQLGFAYHGTGQYKKEKKILDELEHYQPDNPWLFRARAILAFAEKDSVAANRYIAKYIPIVREGSSDAHVAFRLAQLYFDAGILDKAESYSRKALSLEPVYPGEMIDLANFLIYSNLHLNEVSGLMDKAMLQAKNKTEYYDYLDTKGWGLYKQGKVNEALEILQKCWDEAPFKLYYIRSHYKEMKKAVASQN